MGSYRQNLFRSLSVISLKKYDAIQLVAVVKSLLKIIVNLKSQMIKNTDFDIID